MLFYPQIGYLGLKLKFSCKMIIILQWNRDQFYAEGNTNNMLFTIVRLVLKDKTSAGALKSTNFQFILITIKCAITEILERLQSLWNG